MAARAASRRRPSARPRAARDEDAGEAVTGRLLASAAPAGVSGTGTRAAAAPGLRAPRATDDSSSTTALVLTGLLLAAALGGAALEAHHGRKGLLP